MQCPQCQHENSASARFCEECGQRLSVRCPACGFEPAPSAKFCPECGQRLGAPAPPAAGKLTVGPSTAYTPKHLAEKILISRSALEGERKQVTVLFADIKDSTELIKDLDPEAAQQLLDPAIHIMMDAVHRFEGTVNQVLGDGIMALFGAPIAHEDHALRAGYAALAMQAAMQPYTEAVRRQHGVTLRIRVGLNAGEVVVRAIGNDLHMDYSAVGQTVHLAARMEQLAPPGSILLTAATLWLVEGLVRVTALGPLPVKGLPEPVEGFELLGASELRRRLQVAAARGLTRFVGRQSELAALYQAVERAGAGHGQVVAAVGEAGVGKSRLVYEVVHSHRTQGWRVLESASVSYGKATPYVPVLELLKRCTQVEDRDETRTIRAKVTGQVLTLDEALQETVPALLWLLDALPEAHAFLSLDPPLRRRRTLEALKRVLVRESQVQPLLLVCEDLHWIDTETQALLDSLVESLPTVRLLLLVNYRPEYQHGWGSKTSYTQLRLDPLPPASAEEFLQALLGDGGGAQHAAPLQALKQLLIARTQGNPFFLEESVRALVEAGVLVGERGAYVLVTPLDSLQVPVTVQAVLAARIDRLPPEEKRLLQTAAVIGTEVPLPLLQAIADLPEEALHRGLAHLQAAEFLYEARLFPDLAYTFKHALTHEVAYGTILQERRRILHAGIVEASETLYRDRLTEQVERLAHHAVRGELWDKAVAYCRQAGDKALARSASREAVACFEQALVAVEHLPEGRARHEQAIDVRFGLRHALGQRLEYGRILTYLREAEELAQALSDQPRLGWGAAYMTECLGARGDLPRAVEVGQRALALAGTLGDAALQVVTRLFLGRLYFSAGDYPQAIDLLRQNLVALDGALLREHFGLSRLPSVTSRDILARCLVELGAFTEGLAHGEDSLRLAEAVNHPPSLVEACYGIGYVYLRKGDVRQAIPWLERGLEVGRVWDLPLLFYISSSGLGYAYVLAGRVSDALPLLEQSVSTEGRGFMRSRGHIWLGEALGMRPLQAHCHLGLGMLYGQTGRPAPARTELSAAIELYHTLDMSFWLPQAQTALAQMGEGGRPEP